MIEQVTSINQIEYHQSRFNPMMLPDLANAGPVSASILHSSRHPMTFLTAKPKAQTDDMAWGNMVDMLWLTPDEWDDHFVMLPRTHPRKPTVAQREAKKPSAKTIEAIDWWDNWNAGLGGKSMIDFDTHEKVKEARNMLDAHPIARYIWDHSQKQVILAGDLPGNCLAQGVKVKCMMDLLPTDGVLAVGNNEIPLSECVVDLKQCHDVSEYGMKKAISRFEYHMKMSWYQRLLSGMDDIRPYAILIFQNSNPPYDVHVRIIDSDDLLRGSAIAQLRLDSLTRLDHRDMRNLIDSEIQVITLSNWMRDAEEGN